MATTSAEPQWANINFERRDLKSPQKSPRNPMILKKFAFSFAFTFGKQNVTDIVMIILFSIYCISRLDYR